VAGRFLGDADDLHIIRTIGDGELWVALAAWTLVFVAMLGHLARTLLLPARGEPTIAE
jgi:hypothetical protein